MGAGPFSLVHAAVTTGSGRAQPYVVQSAVWNGCGSGRAQAPLPQACGGMVTMGSSVQGELRAKLVEIRTKLLDSDIDPELLGTAD